MAIDGTVFNTADTKANSQAFGRSSNQYGPGAISGTLCALSRMWDPCSVGLQTSRYDVSEVHGAHQLLTNRARHTLLVDAGITGGGFLSMSVIMWPRAAALEAGAWRTFQTAALADGSVLAWVTLTWVKYPMKKGMWVRLISYRLTDERLGKWAQSIA